MQFTEADKKIIITGYKINKAWKIKNMIGHGPSNYLTFELFNTGIIKTYF